MSLSFFTFDIKTFFWDMGISIINMRQLWDSLNIKMIYCQYKNSQYKEKMVSVDNLFFIMGILILAICHIYVETFNLWNKKHGISVYKTCSNFWLLPGSDTQLWCQGHMFDLESPCSIRKWSAIRLFHSPDLRRLGLCKVVLLPSVDCWNSLGQPYVRRQSQNGGHASRSYANGGQGQRSSGAIH